MQGSGTWKDDRQGERCALRSRSAAPPQPRLLRPSGGEQRRYARWRAPLSCEGIERSCASRARRRRSQNSSVPFFRIFLHARRSVGVAVHRGGAQTRATAMRKKGAPRQRANAAVSPEEPQSRRSGGARSGPWPVRGHAAVWLRRPARPAGGAAGADADELPPPERSRASSPSARIKASRTRRRQISRPCCRSSPQATLVGLTPTLARVLLERRRARAVINTCRATAFPRRSCCDRHSQRARAMARSPLAAGERAGQSATKPSRRWGDGG